MGWFAINVVLPVLAPMLMMLLASKVCIPRGIFSKRLSLLRIAKDGQLGWVAAVFSSNTAYEIFARVQVHSSAQWTGLALSVALAILVISSMLAILGAIFPVTAPKNPLNSVIKWCLHYRLLLGTTIILLLAASLHCAAHFALEPACKS